MTPLQRFFIFASLIVTFILIWSNIYFMNSQKSKLKELTSETKKLESTVNMGEPENAAHVSYTKMHSLLNNTLKYILIWTEPNKDPLMYLGKGQEVFVEKKCKVNNCYITTNRFLLPNITQFDALLFNGAEILFKKNPKYPQMRSPRQKYVFASIESSDYYSICDNRLNGYFNVSWTYKLDSDIFYGYIAVRNAEGELIGPNKEMHWMSIDEMKPINDTIKTKLSTKKKLAAWLVSNCNAPSGRDEFVRRVQNKLRRMGNGMTVDMYGACGSKSCRHADMPNCLKMIEEEYYFYFSFENSFAEDYVTEKVLHPLQHYTVPVVYGTANYTRFIPDGIYLNALELGEDVLADKMVELTNDKEKYYNYFKWINHYTFHYMEESPETDFHCKFCEAMNDDNLMNKTTVIENLQDWWNPPKVRTRGNGVVCSRRT